MYNYIDEIPEYLQEQAEAYFDYADTLPERIEQDELDVLHEQALVEELAWYNHARQMGWE
jgi:hypothetical protein